MTQAPAFAPLVVYTPRRATIVSRHRLHAAPQGQRHYHGGKLTKYEIGPPALLLSASDEARLRGGRAVLQTIVSEDGESRRMIMVQDIHAPSHIVLGWVANPSSRDAAGR